MLFCLCFLQLAKVVAERLLRCVAQENSKKKISRCENINTSAHHNNLHAMSTSPGPSPPNKGNNQPMNLFGDSVRYKISVMRKSAAGSPNSKSLGSPAWKGKASTVTNKVVCHMHTIYKIYTHHECIRRKITT